MYCFRLIRFMKIMSFRLTGSDYLIFSELCDFRIFKIFVNFQKHYISNYRNPNIQYFQNYAIFEYLKFSWISENTIFPTIAIRIFNIFRIMRFAKISDFRRFPKITHFLLSVSEYSLFSQLCVLRKSYVFVFRNLVLRKLHIFVYRLQRFPKSLTFLFSESEYFTKSEFSDKRYLNISCSVKIEEYTTAKLLF